MKSIDVIRIKRLKQLGVMRCDTDTQYAFGTSDCYMLHMAHLSPVYTYETGLS